MRKLAVLCAVVVLCGVGCGKRDKSSAGPEPLTTDNDPSLQPTQTTVGCQKVARRVQGCAAQLDKAFGDELLKWAPEPSDARTRGALLRLQRFFIRSWLRHNAAEQVKTLLAQKGVFCHTDGLSRENSPLAKSFSACTRWIDCGPLARCLVRQGAFDPFVKVVKEQQRESKGKVSGPVNLNYHFGLLAGLSQMTVMFSCSCSRLLPEAARILGKEPKAAKLLPCKQAMQRPLQCVDALFSEAVSRNNPSGKAAPQKDTSITRADARQRLSRAAGLLKSNLGLITDPQSKCQLDQLRKAPPDIRKLMMSLFWCGTEKSCKALATCLRRVADTP